MCENELVPHTSRRKPMNGLRQPLPLALTALFLPSVALACLWDSVTLLQERNRFPDTLELITGKFLRHSQEFYYWRIQDRLEKLRSDPDNLALYDDLGVAYDKTGQHDLAIQTMLDKDKRKPGLYETEANLGTFYIHAFRPTWAYSTDPPPVLAIAPVWMAVSSRSSMPSLSL